MTNQPSVRRFLSVLPNRRQAWRWFLPISLVLLFLFIMLWLPWQAQRMEANERQEQLIADTLWVEQAILFQLGRNEETLRLIGSDITTRRLSANKFKDRITPLLHNDRELISVTWFDERGRPVTSSSDTVMLLASHPAASRTASDLAHKKKLPQYAQPAAPAGQTAPMTMDYHMPLFMGSEYSGSLVARYSLSGILDEMVPWWFAQDNEVVLADTDENVLIKRADGGPGRGVYTHSKAVELPGLTLMLKTNSVKSAPKLLPNLLVGSVIVLTLGLLWSLWALWRDINRRLAAEGALRQEVAFRSAMENSLFTGLRARDLEGRITYVNPAFCAMVGIPAEELVGRAPPMPYWAPEALDEYLQRFSQVLSGTITPQFETIFQRRNGERFPVLIFESPLVDESGRQTGWMGSILDISDRKRIEDLNRQQQEKLQTSARLATMGEIASTLAHELNQPLAAISSYTTGALNMIDGASPTERNLDPGMLQSALEKARAQAQRAGHIIRSVHAFVRKREPIRETTTITAVIERALPLIELQAQRFFVSVVTQLAPDLPPILADSTLLEQVLLNLTRNGIEAMQDAAPERRILRISAALEEESPSPNIVVSVTDYGHGISVDVAKRLFSPFFSTKAEGMGMGLNICRTAIEFHGGTLTHRDNPQGGTIFRFSLPVGEAVPATGSAAEVPS